MKTQFKARQKAYSAFIKTEYEIIKKILNLKFNLNFIKYLRKKLKTFISHFYLIFYGKIKTFNLKIRSFNF